MADTLIDQDVFDELSETAGPEFVVELVDTFIDETPAMFEDLTQACTAADADGFRRAAHTIKSNATVFGATALAELAREIELSGLQDEVEQDMQRIATLRAACTAAQEALQTLCSD